MCSRSSKHNVARCWLLRAKRPVCALRLFYFIAYTEILAKKLLGLGSTTCTLDAVHTSLRLNRLIIDMIIASLPVCIQRTVTPHHHLLHCFAHRPIARFVILNSSDVDNDLSMGEQQQGATHTLSPSRESPQPKDVHHPLHRITHFTSSPHLITSPRHLVTSPHHLASSPQPKRDPWPAAVRASACCRHTAA